MSKKKKSGNKTDKSVKVIILVTAILNLIKALVETIRYLIE